MLAQLKTLMALGTATIIVSRAKIMFANSLMPLVNMWCAQTSDPTAAMDMDEKAMALYPKMGRLAKVGMTSEMMPMAGRIMM